MTPAELRALMTTKGLAADEVALLVSASERAVYYWLAGERTMPASTAELLELKAAGMPDAPDDRAAENT